MSTEPAPSGAGPSPAPGDLAAVMGALQAIGAAVTADDADAYGQAVAHAQAIGCAPEQIRDAYDYRARLRLRSGCAPVRFDPVEG